MMGNRIERICKELVGAPPFDYQERIIRALAKKKNVFGVLPTGGGKSLCYQAPASMSDGLVLVFSPLISLMKDQVDKSKKMGLRAERITHDVPQSEIRKIYRNLKNFDLLYVAPERLKSSVFLDRMRNTSKLAVIALDEFHEHDKSSRDFRPSYALVKDFLSSRKNVPVVALTATADEDVELEFKLAMRSRPYERVVASPCRNNLHFEVMREVSLLRAVEALTPVQEEGAAAIVYCSTRKICDNLNTMFLKKGLNTRTYHGGLPARERHETQEVWMDGAVNTIVATNAFGMGVDKSNVRVVFHWTQPGSVFQYVQEAGRAGRDGQDSRCLLNLSADGLRIQQYFVNIQNPGFEVYENIWNYLEEKKKKRVVRTTLGSLARVCDLRQEMRGQVVSALCFMEYVGGLTTSPGMTKYQLPVLDRRLCAEYAGRFSSVKMENRLCQILVHPNNQDPAPEMIRRGAVAFGFPKRFINIQRCSRSLPITNDDVVAKRARANAKLSQVRDFAAAPDKDVFIEEVFLQREKEEVSPHVV